VKRPSVERSSNIWQGLEFNDSYATLKPFGLSENMESKKPVHESLVQQRYMDLENGFELYGGDNSCLSY